jgi:haloalkane dehalogenase
MHCLRTPDDRFDQLDGWSFDPHYVEVDDGDGATLRVAYIDEGPRLGEVVLCLHGEPSWSYLYRHMVPVLVKAGLRVVAPDLVGFGRSDKPAARSDYTYARHVAWMAAALLDTAGLGLTGITLVGQDWGGLIGLRLVAEHPDAFARVVTANTFLPTGDRPPNEAFLNWQRFSQTVEQFPVGFIINSGCTTDLAPEVLAGYDAPFPDETFKEGARQFPLLVPTGPDDPAAAANRAAWEGLRIWTKPWLCAFSDGDPITKGADQALLKQVPGTAGMPHTTITGAGHFLQEDKGAELAEAITAFVAVTPAATGRA